MTCADACIHGQPDEVELRSQVNVPSIAHFKSWLASQFDCVAEATTSGRPGISALVRTNPSVVRMPPTPSPHALVVHKRR